MQHDGERAGGAAPAGHAAGGVRVLRGQRTHHRDDSRQLSASPLPAVPALVVREGG